VSLSSLTRCSFTLKLFLFILCKCISKNHIVNIFVLYMCLFEDCPHTLYKYSFTTIQIKHPMPLVLFLSFVRVKCSLFDFMRIGLAELEVK